MKKKVRTIRIPVVHHKLIKDQQAESGEVDVCDCPDDTRSDKMEENE